MKLRVTPAVIFRTLILGAALFQTGCATTGNQQSTTTRVTMKALEEDYVAAMTQVDVTGDSLQALLDPAQPDEQKAFEKYATHVQKMKDMGKRLFEHANRLNTEQKDYFEEWRKQGDTYSDPQIEALSEQRRADLSQVFANISEASVGVKGSLKAYISDIEQIKTYLSTDLTAKGIVAITPTVQQAITDGENLKDAVKPVLTAIGSARMELARGGSQ